MVEPKGSTPEELAHGRDARVALRQLDQQERRLALLRQAKGYRKDFVSAKLNEAIQAEEGELTRLQAIARSRIVPRRRPVKTDPDPSNKCTIYLDECGSHSMRATGEFGAFVLGAVIIQNDDYPKLNRLWKQWKKDTLGSANKRTHEPDVRRGTGSFWFGGNLDQQSKARQSLKTILSELDFRAIVCVINRAAYLSQKGEEAEEALDNSLPTHPYLMTLDFLMERLVMVLDQQFAGAKGRVVAEGRGPLEDALLQGEYVRLLIEGTSYVSDSWFRQQLEPGIEFRTKDDNVSGLQIADLLARPCGEKVLHPDGTPERWPVFRAKLCQGKETEHSILGIKIIPWDDRYYGLWKS